jgi:hypothetical protein
MLVDFDAWLSSKNSKGSAFGDIVVLLLLFASGAREQDR